MRNRELLSQFLNGEITSQQLRTELKKQEILIFEIEINTPHEEPPLDRMGFYTDSKEVKHEQTYAWYLDEAKVRATAICLLILSDESIMSRI